MAHGQQRGVREIIVQDEISPLKAFLAFHCQQPGIARPGTDEVDNPLTSGSHDGVP